MLNKAVRMHGREDLRLDTFELPPIGEDEVLVKVVSDSICMSSYKAAIQGEAHKRVPEDIAAHPVIIGHEFCGVIERVGARWANRFAPGQRFTIQPNIDYRGTLRTPGYAFEYCGGDAQYAILIPEIMEQDCLLAYRGEAFFQGSLAEPLSCVIGAFHAQYHTRRQAYVHDMGIREGGRMALLGAAGPMGLAAIDYAIHCDRRPALLVVTDVDEARLERAARIYTAAEAAHNGVRLVYAKPPEQDARALTALAGEAGYDDVFVFAPVPALIEQGDALLGYDGCLNFFAGPTDRAFSSAFNFYNVHYAAHHLAGTSGGNIDDMREALDMIAAGRLNPAGMVTHIGGLDAAAQATLALPKLPGGKKLIYTGISLSLTAIDDLGSSEDPLLRGLGAICARSNGLWCAEAERYLLDHAKRI